MFINQFDSIAGSYVTRWPVWLHPIMMAATIVGLPVVVVGVALAGTIVAWKHAQSKIALALLVGVAGLGVNTILKYGIHRIRPDTPFALAMKIKSYSFPSGHAFGSVAVYGLLAYLALRYLPSPWNGLIMMALVGLITIIGLSRVYLGAHYPTDVLGGWMLGLITLALIINFIKP